MPTENFDLGPSSQGGDIAKIRSIIERGQLLNMGDFTTQGLFQIRLARQTFQLWSKGLVGADPEVYNLDFRLVQSNGHSKDTDFYKRRLVLISDEQDGQEIALESIRIVDERVEGTVQAWAIEEGILIPDNPIPLTGVPTYTGDYLQMILDWQVRDEIDEPVFLVMVDESYVGSKLRLLYLGYSNSVRSAQDRVNLKSFNHHIRSLSCKLNEDLDGYIPELIPQLGEKIIDCVVFDENNQLIGRQVSRIF